jgi:hypothetical protein
MASAASQRFTPYSKKKEGSTKPNQEELYQLPTSNTQDTEKAPKLSYRQLDTLLMNTTLPLNSSYSKEVVVGLNGSDQTFSPEVQIVRRTGANRYGIALSQSEWAELMEHSDEITKYFYEDNPCKTHKPIKLQNIVLSFQIVYGRQTLVVTKPSSDYIPSHLSDTVAIQKPSWDTLMVTRRCINQALLDSSTLTEKAMTQFDILSRAAVDHLRLTTSLDSTSSDEEIKKPLVAFLNNLELNGLNTIDKNLHLLCYNICLYSLPVFVARFKLFSFYSS